MNLVKFKEVEGASAVLQSMGATKVAAVVVTFNRLKLLQECVAALRGQTRVPNEIIVVNNGSTDGTTAWLDCQQGLTVITQENLGSSGGQYTGIKAAYGHDHDWFWCMDDDTIPQPDALEQLMKTPYFARPDTGFLASVALWADGQPHPMHSIHPTEACTWTASILTDHCIRVTMSTFVSLMVSRTAVAAVGLPVKAFFLIVDDYEFTDRISQRFKGYTVLDSKVMHKTRLRENPSTWRGGDLLKECYHVRNQVAWIMHRRNCSLWGKTQHLLSLSVYNVRRVLTGSAHPKLLLWQCKGFFFRYRIDPI